VEASLQNLHEKIDAGPVRKATKKTNARPSRRDSTVFAAIILDLKGMRYCSFLKDHGVKPKVVGALPKQLLRRLSRWQPLAEENPGRKVSR